MQQKRILRSLRLLKLEMLLGNILFAVPILNFFWRDHAHMSQLGISVSQAIFMAVTIGLDVPTGWLADQFSRKWSNVIGDTVSAVGFFGYMFANSLTIVVIAEIVLGIGMACSNGADGPLLEEYCDKLGRDFHAEMAKIQKWTPLAVAASMAFGGFVGAKNAQLAVGLSAIAPAIGACALLFIVEDKRTRQPSDKHPLKEMWEVVHYSLSGHKALAATIWAKTVVSASTHAVVWVTTPILILCRVPVWLVGVGWALLNLSSSIGAWLAAKYGTERTTETAFVLPLGAIILSCLALGLWPSIYTAIAVIVMGAARGWQSTILPVRVQLLAPSELKATVNSVASTLGRIAYIPLVLAIGSVGNANAAHAYLLNGTLFVAFGAGTVWYMRRHIPSPQSTSD